MGRVLMWGRTAKPLLPGNQEKKNKIKNVHNSYRRHPDLLFALHQFCRMVFCSLHIVHVYIFINTTLYVYRHAHTHIYSSIAQNLSHGLFAVQGRNADILFPCVIPCGAGMWGPAGIFRQNSKWKYLMAHVIQWSSRSMLASWSPVYSIHFF